jgi:predicted dehydrogenase
VAIRVNAGPVAPGHWTLDLDVGGGRILGEVCHFVDLAADLLDADPVEVSATAARSGAAPQASEDLVATVRFSDGSVATVAYTAHGDSGVGKERVEAFAGGEAWLIDDWRSITHSSGGRARTRRADGDKGHARGVATFLAAVREGQGLEPEFRRAMATTRATLAVVEALSLGAPVEL